MIDIITIKGEKYSFDESTQRIFKDGLLLSSVQVEPVYSRSSADSKPVFSGLLLKETNSILSRSGKISPVTDINNIV
jgi:hypothetical protein